jgi:hypothetical protein
LQRAVEILVECESTPLTLKELLHQLVREGEVSESTYTCNFSRRLREYVKKQGHFMSTSDTGSVFFLQVADRAKRVAFAKSVLSEVKDGVPATWVFVDETTFEEFPHPKGEPRCVRTPRQRAHTALHCSPLAWSTGLGCVDVLCKLPAVVAVVQCERAAPPLQTALLHLPVRKSPSHVHLPRLMKRPQTLHSGNQARRSLKLAVVLKKGEKPIVVHLSGSRYKGCPDIKQYAKDKLTKAEKAAGKVVYYRDFNQKEYMDLIKATTDKWGASGITDWYHDGDPAHKPKAVTDLLAAHGVTDRKMSPRSPDLDPLDYAVFGLAKRKWRKLRTHMSYDEACVEIVQFLSTMQVDAIIDDLPLRLKACIHEKGRHFEGGAEFQRLKSGARKRCRE